MKKVAICKFEDLIGEEDAISMSTMLKIDKIKDKKTKLIVSTNRSIEDVLYYNRDFPFIDYIVNEKGYYFYDVKKGKKTINNKISKQKLNKMCKLNKNNTTEYIGDNGIIEENRIKDEDIYEIHIFNSGKKKVIKEDTSYKNIITKISIKLKVNEEDLIKINKNILN